MDPQDLNRRDFHRLTMAAFGGVLAGTISGCGDQTKPAAPAKPAMPPSGAGTDAKPGKPDEPEGQEVAQVEGDPHACSGLNACKNQGATGKNDCAGQGVCATKAWHHSCGGQNDCKGQGGCGDTATMNECKQKGACHIPLMDVAWKTARKHFEEKMKEQGKEVGEGMSPNERKKQKK